MVVLCIVLVAAAAVVGFAVLGVVVVVVTAAVVVVVVVFVVAGGGSGGTSCGVFLLAGIQSSQISSLSPYLSLGHCSISCSSRSSVMVLPRASLISLTTFRQQCINGKLLCL